MPNEPRVVAIDHVGKRGELSEKHTICAVFHNFRSLPCKSGQFTESKAMSCHGHKWVVVLYPGGNAINLHDDYSEEDDDYVAICLKCVSATSQNEVDAHVELAVSGGTWVDKETFGGGDPLGFFYLSRRENIKLNDGDLTVNLRIQVRLSPPPLWTPKNTLNEGLLRILDSATETGDVVFKVGGEEISAHKVFLEERAPALAELAENHLPGKPVPISSVKSQHFRDLLRYVYANEIPDLKYLQKEACQLLDVANLSGCTGLKLTAESEICKSGINVDNAADLILLAEAKNCALLKEAATEFLLANPCSVMASSGWGRVKQSHLIEELFETLYAAKDSTGESGDLNQSSVTTLRRKLEDVGKEVDGSKEILVKRLRMMDTERL